MIADYIISLSVGHFVPAVLLFASACAGTGRLITAAFRGNRSCAVGWFVRFVLGLNSWYLAALILGLAGWMRPAIVLPLLFCFAAAAWIPGVKVRPWRKMLCHLPFIAVPAILLLLLLFPVFCPPTGWDALTYHLTLPLRWSRDAFPMVYDDLPYSGFPSAGQLVYWLLIELGGIRAPAMFVWLVFPVAGLHFYLIGCRRCGYLTGMTLSLVLLAAPVSLLLLKDSYIEPLLLLNVPAAAELSRRPSGPAWRNNLFWGILLGGCCALKLNGVIVAAGLLLLSPAVERCSWRQRFERAMIIFGVALLFILPFYLRPWLMTGNPLFPFFASWFSDGDALRLSSRFHHLLAHGKYGAGLLYGIPGGLLMLAWRGDIYDSCFGWPLLLLLPLALAGTVVALRRRDRAGILLAGSLVIMYVGWGFSAQQARFLLPWFGLLLLAVADALRGVSLRMRFVVSVLLLVALLPALPLPLHHARLCFRFLTGTEIRLVDYIYSGTGPGYLSAAEMIARTTPPDARIAVFFEHRLLYIPRRATVVTPFFQARHFTPPPFRAEEMGRSLRDSCFTHILTGEGGRNPDRPPIYHELVPMIRGHLAALADNGIIESLWSGEGYTLYRITPEDSDPGRKEQR